ncbi:MAG: RluA family pseudouridine synthase [Actinomycetota bacterium]
MTEHVDDEVPGALDDQRVDRVVSFVADLSRRVAQELIAARAVSLDGRDVTRASERVRAGQRLTFSYERESRAPEADPSVEVPVVHVDVHVVVVDKPAGMVVHPGSGVRGATMVNGLLAQFPELATVGEADRPGIVHRLDRGTSGLLMVARTAGAHAALVGQLQERTVLRRYETLVEGRVDAESGTIDAPLGRSPRDATRRAVVADGLDARTHYEVLARHREPDRSGPAAVCTSLECRLETGRTHQIRAHLSAIGHPVIGDVDYGAESDAVLGRGRPFLHARDLGFEHPTTGELMMFTSPLPDDLLSRSSGLVETP